MITSRSNALARRVRALRDKKNRDISREFVVEGAKSVAEALSCGAKITAVIATESGAALIGELKLSPEIFSDDVFKSVSEEVSPQGVLAIVEKPLFPRTDITEKCLFLDGVSDPANVGAMIRSAAAFGFNTVLIADGADAYSNKAVRASMGGIFRVKVLSGTREEMISSVKVPFVIADMGGADVMNADIPEKFCLVIGNEAHGVSDTMRGLAGYTVAIPMDNGMESLNAAVSAGIIMYATRKKS